MNPDSPVHPVGNVQSPVQTEGCEVMCGDRLGLARSLEHEQLRKDGDRLEPDGEGPGDLKGRELVVEQEGKDGDGAKDVRELEGIEGGVVCRPADSQRRNVREWWQRPHRYLNFMR